MHRKITGLLGIQAVRVAKSLGILIAHGNDFMGNLIGGWVTFKGKEPLFGMKEGLVSLLSHAQKSNTQKD